MKFSIQSIYNWYRQGIRNPKTRLWFIAGTLAYLISPADLLPDVFPVVGQIDDVLLLGLLATELTTLFLDYYRNRRPERTVAETSEPSTSPAAVDIDAVTVER